MVLVGKVNSVTPGREGDIAIAKLYLDCEDDCNVEIRLKTIPTFASVRGKIVF